MYFFPTNLILSFSLFLSLSLSLSLSSVLSCLHLIVSTHSLSSCVHAESRVRGVESKRMDANNEKKTVNPFLGRSYIVFWNVQSHEVMAY
jgi:hypothetical protein